MFWLYIIAALGIVWLYVSLTKGLKEWTKKGIFKGWKNKYLRDFIVSIVVIMFASSFFIGVTGLVIGLLASVGISIYIQLASALEKKSQK